MSARVKGASRDLSEVDQGFVCFGSPMSYFSMKVCGRFGERGFSNATCLFEFSLVQVWLGLSHYFPRVSTFRHLTEEVKADLKTRSGTHQVLFGLHDCPYVAPVKTLHDCPRVALTQVTIRTSIYMIINSTDNRCRSW